MSCGAKRIFRVYEVLESLSQAISSRQARQWEEGVKAILTRDGDTTTLQSKCDTLLNFKLGVGVVERRDDHKLQKACIRHGKKSTGVKRGVSSRTPRSMMLRP